MAENDELGGLWRSEILTGLSTIPHTGAVPGTLVVWGEYARPILNSAGQRKPTLVATAELGRGRVAVVAHEGLLKSPADLVSNIEKWLNRGETRDKQVLNWKSKKTSINPGELLVWSGAQSTGDVTTEVVINHLLDGGSLLHAMCPWGWLQLNSGKCLNDMPLTGVLDTVGISYTECYGSIPHEGLDIKQHTSVELNHALITLRAIRDNLDRYMDDDCKDEMPCLDLSTLNGDRCKDAITPELCRLGELLGCTRSQEHSRSSDSEPVIKKIAPTHAEPLRSNNKRVLVDIIDSMARSEGADLVSVDTFLGSFNSPAATLCRTIDVSSTLHDIHPTGLYLVRGEILVLRLSSVVPDGWSIRVGAHSDVLSGVEEPLRRWPRLVITKPITERVTKVHSPYGGLVYLQSPEGVSEIHACLENIVEAPLFKLDDPESVRSWPKRRLAPGLWADVMGEHITITLPATSVRQLDDLTAVMRTWDSVVRAHHELRGTDPRLHRREWVVTDEQPSAGYMHSGYPIVTHLDVSEPGDKHFLLDNKHLLDGGSWGMYHELGHNMQRGAWTFSGTGEVTCNIFTLHAMDKVSDRKIWIHEWLTNQLKTAEKYIESSGSFAQWKAEPGLALFIYAQIAHHFGWQVYKTVFRQYEEDDPVMHHSTDQGKIDAWFNRISRACRRNLAPLFEFWRIPISPESATTLSDLTPYLPDDEVINSKPSYAQQIRDKYLGCCADPK